MKISIITRHSVINYGSLSQAFAMQSVIEHMGYDCEVIDYVRPGETYRNLEKSLLARKRKWNNNPLKRLIYLAIRQPESIYAGRHFEAEQKKYLKLSKRYSTLYELKVDCPEADVYITGSDQVWGPVEDGSYDSVYCLSFTDKKKIAYAASFGHTVLDDSLSTYYKENLTKYSHLAVREDKAVELLKELELESEQVLDPTLLLQEKFWEQFFVPIKYKRYILVYQLHNNSKFNKYVERVAKKKGVPIVRVSAYYHQIFWPGKLVLCPKMGEFLSYIKNAECLITDSFHGTAFAINFNTPFVEILPTNNTEERNVSILKLTGLIGRILKDDNDLDLVDRDMDFSYANAAIQNERNRSIELLRQMIER